MVGVIEIRRKHVDKRRRIVERSWIVGKSSRPRVVDESPTRQRGRRGHRGDVVSADRRRRWADAVEGLGVADVSYVEVVGQRQQGVLPALIAPVGAEQTPSSVPLTAGALGGAVKMILDRARSTPLGHRQGRKEFEMFGDS